MGDFKGHKGFKGFKKGLVCKNKQYAENTVFEETDAVICHRGMHYCANPFDVLEYYDLVNNDGSFNEFAEVEALAEPKTDDNKKFCTTKLRIGAKLDFSCFIKACVNFVIDRTDVKGITAKANNDNEVVISSNAKNAKIGSSGDSAQIGSSGDSAQIGSSGDSARIDSTGNDTVVCCAGHRAIVKAKKGSWITLAEWEYSREKDRCIPLCVKTEFVDGSKIKEDTFYTLKNGEFTEA